MTALPNLASPERSRSARGLCGSGSEARMQPQCGSSLENTSASATGTSMQQHGLAGKRLPDCSTGSGASGAKELGDCVG